MATKQKSTEKDRKKSNAATEKVTDVKVKNQPNLQIKAQTKKSVKKLQAKTRPPKLRNKLHRKMIK